MTDQSLLLMGPCLVVRYMRYQGGWPAREFLDANPSIKAKLLAIADHLATHGKLLVSERGHMLRGKYNEVMELKPGRGRVFGFRHGHDFYLTNGAMKKRAREQKADYEIALRMREDFLEGLSQKSSQSGEKS